MKILYAVQATGNGHISRAMELLPSLRTYGQVDVFLSGANSQLKADMPVRYRSKGVSLFYNNGGGLHYSKTIRAMNPARVWNEVRDLPVQKYDVVINDFECITALACAYKKIPSVNFGHQAAFQSALTPRPCKKDPVGEFILRHYGSAAAYIGLHFERYDQFIHPPVIKKEVLQAKPVTGNHVTVYLSAFSDDVLRRYLGPIKEMQFQVFSKSVDSVRKEGNICFMPVNNKLFTASMIGSAGVITGAGFETPAEAMHLGKKLMAIPIRGQYEQLCNAAALKRLGVHVTDKLDDTFGLRFQHWMQSNTQQPITYTDNAASLVQELLENYPYKNSAMDLVYPNLIFN